jgi:hypothetical protein
MRSVPRRKKTKGQAEDDLLKNQRWSGLHENDRIQAFAHPPEVNNLARARTAALLRGGYGAINWNK